MLGPRKETRSTKKDDKREQFEEATVEASEPEGSMASLLAELKSFRKEHTDASNDTKATLVRVENTLKEVVERTAKLEQEMTDIKERVSDNEDQLQRHDRAIRYMLQREAKLSAKCEDLESRSRRNNLRIFGVREGEEKNDMIRFITGMIRNTLKLPQDLDLGVERAHRSLTMKPREDAPPRSIIVRFLDYRVKDRVLQEAWKIRGITYQDQKVFFDQDYTADIQKKRKQVREVIKQLKERKMRAVSPFPAQLKIQMDSGVKTFSTLAQAAPTLKQLGIKVNISEREIRREDLLHNNTWTTRSKDPGNTTMASADLDLLLREDV
ncbi:unnamed protein product [Knipowitschia caucasica]